MTNVRKILSVLLAAVLVLTLFAACGGTNQGNPDNPDKPSDPSAGYTGEMVENGNTFADPNWLPVVKNPITVTATVRDEMGYDWNQRTIFKEIADKTGVMFEMRVMTTNEVETLMFASRNYPDCTFRIYNTAFAFDEAKTMGDVFELSPEFLEAYAPNWYNLFSEYNEIYQLCLHSDGKLYTLPNITLEESTYALRDLSIINAAWLDELGLDVPTTTDEFIDFLRAVKNAAGTGSIPADVIPLKLRHYTDINSWYTIMDWYGCYQGFALEYIQDGKVTTNMGSPAIKPAINYTAQIHSEGLLNSNFTSAVWADYIDIYEQVEKGTPNVAASFTYDVPASEDYICFAPLDTGTGVEPVIHDFSLESRLIPGAFAIFSTCKTPIAIIRALDQYAGGESAVRARYGEEGENGYWQWVDGVQVLNTSLSFDMPESAKGWNDYGPNIISEEIAEGLFLGERESNTRTRWYYELYKGKLPKDRQKYPQIALKYLSAEEQSEAAVLWSRLCSANKAYMTKWITGKTDMNAEWDDYVQSLKNTGLERRLELLNKAYEAYLNASIEN